jgi:hypothetical protein
MGHPGLLVKDYVAGIPIWYIPNTRHPKIYRSFQRTEEEMERGHRPVTQ